MNILINYNKAKKELFEYFGYKEDWVAIPVDDATEYYWNLTGEGSGDSVRFGKKIDVITLSGDHYENEIYAQRFLKKWVYQGKDYTMICVDTHVDGNKFLQIFDNSKKITHTIWRE